MKMDEEFDWLSDPIALTQAYKERDFDAKFISWIAKDVILVLSPQLLDQPHNSTCDEELVNTRLLRPLERFMFDLDDNSSKDEIEKVFQEIKSFDQPSKLCRRILKSGDVTFSCNDCALDQTCVVCIDCFLKGAHKDHNYRMSNSDGGGCCDCGDVEAWKKNHACSDHLGLDQSSVSLTNFDNKELRSIQIEQDKKNILETIKRLPKKLATRYFLLCQASLRYALMMLRWKDNDMLPDALELEFIGSKNQDVINLLSLSKNKKNYFTVLFNDEVHTYDHVITTLVKIIKCSKMTASIMASTISREGRSLIVKDNKPNCDDYSSKITNVRDGTQDPLKVVTIHGKILAHQAFALKLVEWIRKMSSMCDGFRMLTALTILGTGDLPGDDYSHTLFERVALSNTSLWRIARMEWNDLFVKTLLTDYSIKQEVSRLITRNYNQLIYDFIQDDHEHSVSILTLTIQIYTVPSLTCMLIEEESALSITLGTFVEVCKTSRRLNQGISYDNRLTFDMIRIRRACYAIHDFNHLISLKPTNWNFNLRKSVMKALNLFLDLLESLQGMDSVKRQLGQHLEYEPDWESGMTLQGKLISLISRFVEFINYDEEVLVEAVSETLTRLGRICRYKNYVTRELFEHSAACINYDVTTMLVSIHLPLTRFAAALLVLLMQRRPCDKSPYDESLVVIPRQDDVKSKMTMIEIMEQSLRASVMIAQFRSGMWRRNGYSLVNQIINFQSPVMRKEMFDRDILVLQECAAMCEPNEFMIHLINKFNLFNWITSDTVLGIDGSSSSSSTTTANKINDEEILTQTMSLGDEFLQLILILIGERYNIGIGKVTQEDIMKNEIIQLLCVSSMARSDLTTKLQVNDYELDCIKAVAELKRSCSTSKGKYELREEFYDRFNPFFYHYTRRYQSNALDAQLKRKKNLGHQLICCPPPKPVELTDQFSNLNELLQCDILLLLIQKILTRSLNIAPDVNPASQSKTSSATNSNESSSSRTSDSTLGSRSKSKSTTSSSTSTSPTKELIKFGASELQLDQTLHLIGIGLWEQERNTTGFRFIDSAHAKGIFNLIRDNYEKGERNRDLLMWLMKKTDALIDTITQQAQSGDVVVSDSSLEICADIKKIFMSTLTVPDTSNQESKKHNSLLANQRRERIMAMMKANQEKFLSYQTTKELVAETEKHESPKVTQQQTFDHHNHPQSSSAAGASSSIASTSAVSMVVGGRQRKTKPPKSIMGFASSRKINKSGDTSRSEPMLQRPREPNAQLDQSEFLIDMDNMDQQNIACDEPDQLAQPQEQLIVPPETTKMCILCRDEQQIGFDKPTMVLLAFVQRSAVLSQNREQRRIPNYAIIPNNLKKTALRDSYLMGQQRLSFASDNSLSFDATFMPADLFFSPHISTCGHVMHYDCWRGHTQAVSNRETNRLNRSARHASFEPEKQEILCPLCDCISNATIPLLPNYTTFAQRTRPISAPGSSSSDQRDIPFENIPEGVFNLTLEKVNRSSGEQLSAFLTAMRSSVDTLKQIRHIKEPSQSSGTTQTAAPTTGLVSPNKTPIPTTNFDGSLKYLRLKHPRCLNDVLVELDETAAWGLRNFLSTTRSNRIQSDSCSKAFLSSMTALAERIHMVGLDFEKKVTDWRMFLMTSWTVAYTLQTYERTSRFKGSPIFDDLESSSKSIGLSSLLRYAFASMMTHQSDMIQNILIEKLRYLLISDEHLSASLCCLDIDAFETLVSLLVMLPKLYYYIDEFNPTQLRNKTGGSFTGHRFSSPKQSTRSTSANEPDYQWITQSLDCDYNRNLIHLMVLLNLVQICITLQTELQIEGDQRQHKPKPDVDVGHEYECFVSDLVDSSEPDEMVDSDEARDFSALDSFYRDCIIASGHPNSKQPTVNRKFCARIRARMLPFLRSTAMFMYHISQIPFPAQLKELTCFKKSPEDGSRPEFEQQINWEKLDSEFDHLCRYLNLPCQFGNLLPNHEARHLIRSWLRHSRVMVLIKTELDKFSPQSSKLSGDTKGDAKVNKKKTGDADADDDDDLDLDSSNQEESDNEDSNDEDDSAVSGKKSAGESSSAGPSQQLSISCPTTRSHTTAQLLKHLKQKQRIRDQIESNSMFASEFMPFKFIRQPHLVPRLIDLPYDYSELVDRVSDFTCPSIKNQDSRTPTMCLVCGVILCSHSYCCQRDLNDLASDYNQTTVQRQVMDMRRVSSGSLGSAASAGGSGESGSSSSFLVSASGQNVIGTGAQQSMASSWFPAAMALVTNPNVNAVANHLSFIQPHNPAGSLDQQRASVQNYQQLVGSCTYHAYECSGGVGIFLRIRKCQILLLSGRSKGCYQAAPYNDDHGEADYGLVRGNPLHLNIEQYRKLEQAWLTHSIAEQISRSLEYSPYLSSVNWFLH